MRPTDGRGNAAEMLATDARPAFEEEEDGAVGFAAALDPGCTDPAGLAGKLGSSFPKSSKSSVA